MDLPVRLRSHDTIRWVRRDSEAGIVAALRSAAFDASGQFGWVALDTAQTRAVAAILRADYKLGRRASNRRHTGWKRGPS